MAVNDGVTRPKTRRGLLTFERILAGAEEEFGEKGYFDASVGGIASRADVSVGTFYLYFKSKKDVFAELIRHLQYDVRGEIRRQTEGLADRKEVEQVGLRTFHEYILRHRSLYRLIREAEVVDEELFRWYYDTFAKAYARQLAKAMDDGQVRRTDPEALAYCLIGVAVFTGMRWPVWEKALPSPEASRAVTDFILNGLSPENPSPARAGRGEGDSGQ
jgi:AcrR family transcriptional regulator